MSANSVTAAKTIKPEPDDLRFMRQALDLAQRGLGTTWPNPSVGCVLVRDGTVVGRGWTKPGGRPHAEAEALARAGANAKGATAYVTLEPCSHVGRAEPCADALIAAGIVRCVVGIGDPDPRVGGDGFAKLRAAGIAVIDGVLAEEAGHVTGPFLSRVLLGRPLFTAKLATSLDGRIATHNGDSKWITGEAARARTHLMRAIHDAVMVGSTTAAMDNPELTCRLPGYDGRPRVRIVADGHLRLPLTSILVRSAAALPTWILTRPNVPAERAQAYRDAGVEIINLPVGAGGHLDLRAAGQALAGRGLTSVLVEGGGGLIASLLRAGMVDRLAWFRSGLTIGGDGVAGIAPLGIQRLAAAARWRRLTLETIGDDVLEVLARAD